MSTQHSPNMVVDPFEFIRESNVASIVNGKSIYEIRKNIGRGAVEISFWEVPDRICIC